MVYFDRSIMKISGNTTEKLPSAQLKTFSIRDDYIIKSVKICRFVLKHFR